MTTFAAGLLLAFAGSLHCAVMCGPLAALAGRGRSAVAYHAGRLAVYALLGVAAGVAGGGFAGAGASRALGIAVGLVLIAQAIGAGTLMPRALRAWAPGRAAAGYVSRVAAHLTTHSFLRAGLFGVANGLIPCGLLYAAVIAAAGFGSAASAAAFMAGFGAGSVPAFAGAAALAAGLRTRAPVLARRMSPIALALIGLLLIVRAWPPSPGSGSEGLHRHVVSHLHP